MNAFASTLYRDVTCAAAAMLLNTLFSMAFVESTAVPPGARAHTSAVAVHTATPPTASWFGQPQPAVMVD